MAKSDLSCRSAESTGEHRWFATTHWSLIRAAGTDDAKGREAMEALCRIDWPPVYRFLRHTGHGVAEAEDLAQDYFVFLLRKNLSARADLEKGRFRSFLLHTVTHFAADQRSKGRAKKRMLPHVAPSPAASKRFRAEAEAVARVQHPRIVTTYEIGESDYMAPEQVLEEAAPSADIDALGAILYHALTGRPPFQAASTEATVHQVLESEPVPPRLLNSSVPRNVEMICMKCLERAPARRYCRARDLANLRHGRGVHRGRRGEAIRAPIR